MDAVQRNKLIDFLMAHLPASKYPASSNMPTTREALEALSDEGLEDLKRAIDIHKNPEK